MEETGAGQSNALDRKDGGGFVSKQTNSVLGKHVQHLLDLCFL